MGGNITHEKIEKKKLSFKKKRIENNNQDIVLQTNQKLKLQNKDNYNLALKKLYKSQQNQKINIENKINNINNINCTINTVKSEEKPTIKNNIELLNETNEINSILFRSHKSFEPKHLSFKQLENDINNLNKIENDMISITITTMENTNNKIDPNSVPDSLSNNSDYIDIGQSIFFIRNNYKYISFNKNFYGNARRIRDAYYNKLIITNIWNPLIKEKKSNTLFIFDWDDTLMCTSYIMPIVNSNNLNINTKMVREKLKNLDENISNLLNKSLEHGIVFLITNSSPGWVEYSSTNFLPLTAKVLSNIKIISAKGLFSKKYPGDKMQWKIEAFKYAIEKYNINTKIISNIICLGDSYYDLEAIESLRYCFRNAFIKIIKFKECPHIVELEKQIFIVISQLDFIIKKVKNLSLRVSKKKID